MSAASQSTSPRMDDLFGPPPLIMGEDKGRYLRLHAAIENYVQPEDLLDQFSVRDLTDKLWQQQRNKQSLALLVENAYIDALASLLRPFYSSSADPFDIGRMINSEDPAMRMAIEYYNGETTPKRLGELNNILAIHRISQEHILAKAMELRGAEISTFIRIQANSDNALRMLRKENASRVAAKHGKEPGSD